VRRHPRLTLRILEGVSAFRPIARMAAAHHERLDGSGYDRGLTGDQLSPLARILAVADVAEALSAERPYRGPLGPDEVLAIMRRDVPGKLDARAFAALEPVLYARGATAMTAATIAGSHRVEDPPISSSTPAS
jgi:HD-GYP domain-containing protein (c-di-GMP phosphodiesterase class II)